MKKVFIISALILAVSGIGGKIVAEQIFSSNSEILPNVSQSLPEVKIPDYVAELSQTALSLISKKEGIPVERLQIIHTVTQTALPDVSAFKLIDKESGEIYSIHLDRSGKEVSEDLVLEAFNDQMFVGKMDIGLFTRTLNMKDDEVLPVGLWLRDDVLPEELDIGNFASEKDYIEFHKERITNLTKPVVKFLESKGLEVTLVSELAPAITVNVPKRLLSAVEALPEVMAMYQGDIEYVSHGWPDEMRATRVYQVHSAGYTGRGIKVAVIEGGDSGLVPQRSDLPPVSYCPYDSTTPTASHAKEVALTLAKKSSFGGAAPGLAGILSGTDYGQGDTGFIRCTDWAIQQGAKVINYSFTCDSNNIAQGCLSILTRYADYITRVYNVNVTAAAGNQASYVRVPAIGFNVISVGAYTCALCSEDNISNIRIWSSSNYIDPPSPHNDREEPKIAAGLFSPNSWFGTSFAAPAVAGVIADRLQTYYDLQVPFPPSYDVRAQLFAKAVNNVEGASRLSEKDGVGGLRADPVSGCTQGASFSLSPSTTQWSYQFYINSSVKKVRGAIAWNAFQGGSPNYLNDVADDIDLLVYNPSGQLVASSTSYDNAYEIVDFDPTVSGNYTVQVRLRQSYTNQTVPVRLCMIHYTQ